MIRSLKIDGYRCFSEFRVQGLARVNLLVGKNNCGKTAFLEAVELLTAPSPIRSAVSILRRRDESTSDMVDERKVREYEFAHLFPGHDLRPGTQFDVKAATDDGEVLVSCSADRLEPEEEDGLFEEEEIALEPLGIVASSSRLDGSERVRLTPRGALTYEQLRRLPWRVPGESRSNLYLPPGSLDAGQVANLWREIALNPEEELVIDAVRILYPGIEKLAFVGESARFHRMGRGGMVVKLEGSTVRVPIGSLGDGVWRMLALALALVRCRGGVLLVDEIDTGFHFGVMEDMWRMVLDTARRLDIQVFATTHSSDCVTSLARVCDDCVSGEVSLQRIESERGEAVSFSQDQIRVAAENQIEVR